MSKVPLSDKDTMAIFADEVAENLSSLDPTRQEKIIRRLITILESQSPPGRFIDKKISNIDIIRAGEKCRLYTKTVPNLPEPDAVYHLVHILYVDSDHEYDVSDLVQYGQEAQAKLDTATSFSNIKDIEEYLEDYDALDAGDLKDLL